MDNHMELEVEKQDKGFTLVELLIVIVILGILATVTVFAVRGITDQGQTSACAADKKTLEVAVEAWYAQNGTLTTITEAALVPGLLRAQSTTYDVTSTGGVVAAPNNPAATPPFVNKCT